MKIKTAFVRTGRSIKRGTKKIGFGVVGTLSGVATLAHQLGKAVVAQGRAVVRGQTSFA